MPAPSVIGTPPTHNFATNALSVSHSVTVPSGTNAIIIAGYGFGKASGTALFTSATFNGVTCNDIVGVTRATNRQFCRLFTLYDTHASWPGTGTFTALVNSNEADDIGIMSCCVTNVDTSTPITGSGTNSGTGATTPTISGIASSANDTAFAIFSTYSAGHTAGSGDDTSIDDDQNGAGNVSGYFFTEAGTASAVTVETTYSSGVEYAIAALSLAGTAGGGGSTGSPWYYYANQR